MVGLCGINAGTGQQYGNGALTNIRIWIDRRSESLRHARANPDYLIDFPVHLADATDPLREILRGLTIR